YELVHQPDVFALLVVYELVNNKKSKKHSKLKHNLLQEILVVHITKIVPQLELPGKLLYIKDNQVMTHILIVMAMELHVKNSF
ncbi:hypothetical protein ACUOFC_55505, partial [Escherichia sp. TWPC-MK]